LVLVALVSTIAIRTYQVIHPSIHPSIPPS
jgi:hypothetical protein